MTLRKRQNWRIEYGAWLAVDNTFASPYLQRPLLFGADFVLHSATKYLGGHSDVVGGLIVLNDDELRGKLAFHQNATGSVPGPQDCFLVLRGIKTLGIRMRQHGANALQRGASFYRDTRRLKKCFIPACQQIRSMTRQGATWQAAGRWRAWHGSATPEQALERAGYGGMVSFLARGGETKARELVARTRLFTLAESLGGVESLIEHPGAMTHASLAGSSIEISPALVRLSVGIEDADDLIADLEQALD